MREQPEWVLRNNPDPTVTGLASINNGCSFNFSSVKYDFTLEKAVGGYALSSSDLGEYMDQVDLLSRIITDQLGLKEFTRIGFRAWYLFGFETKEESEGWLKSLGCYSVSDSFSTAFGGSIEAISVAVIIAGYDRKYRVAFNGVERQAQLDMGEEVLAIRSSSLPKDQKKILQRQMATKHRMRSNPEYPAMIDIDAFQEDPPSIDPQDFIQTSVEQFSNRLVSAISK